MKWAHFIHMYQPWWQHPGILEKITNESYRPLIRGFLKYPQTKITININSVLTEMLFDNGYRDVIDNLKVLVEMGRVELTGSAKFHAFLPLLPQEEIRRQIVLNEETNRRYFGEAYNPKGFFSPEMGYSPKVAEILQEMGFKWMLADEVSICSPGDALHLSSINYIKDTNVQVYFREKNPSNVIMSAQARSSSSLKNIMGDRMNLSEYVVTAMDSETFGHHRPGHEEMLFDLMKSPDFENILISEIEKFFTQKNEVIPMDSSWASSQEDVLNGNPYNYWFDKGNKIHSDEWELADIAIRVVKNSKYSDSEYPKLLEEIYAWEDLTTEQRKGEELKRKWLFSRDLLDKALNSDPWWWACAKPWWSIEEIEKGMHSLLKVISSVPDVKSVDLDRADDLYKRILITAHEWQRTGFVDKLRKEDQSTRKLPLSKRFAAGDHYNALLKALKEEEIKARDQREYEKAIKWRDSQYKLERDLDIYDAVHVMDIFRAEGNFDRFKEILAEYKNKYKIISKGQPE